jgi:hypothetical protein
MKAKVCEHCGNRFIPSRINQKYCTAESCRLDRKRRWQRNKLATDADYREAQREAQAAWLAKNPDYYRNYRRSHSSYTHTNRLKQRIRNRRLRGKMDSGEKVAKMDAKMPIFTGLYQLLAVESDGRLIAKMDAKYVQLTELQEVAISGP